MSEPTPSTAAPFASAEGQAALVLAVEKAFLTLPEAQREVLRLKFKRGWGYPQIAEATGHSVSTVGYLVHHGMKNLAARADKA